MKRYTLYLLPLVFLLPCPTVTGQDAESINTSIHLFLSPDYSYRNLGNNGSANPRDGLEKSIPGYCTGVDLSFRKEKPLGIETGIRMMHRGFATKEMLVAGNNSVNHAQVLYHYNYFGIPVMAVYRKQSGKGILCMKGGLISNFLARQDKVSIWEYTDHTEKYHSDLDGDVSKMVLTGVLGIEMGNNIKNNLFYEIGPFLYYDLTSAERRELIETYLWDLGLNFSIYLRL
jgi:hypothetical protein